MLSLHPDFIKKDGQKMFAVIPYAEFITVQEVLQDYEDLISLRKAKEEEKNSPDVSLKQARSLLGI